MVILNKRPNLTGLGQNMPNIFRIVICVPANRARPKQRLANNISLRAWSMKQKGLSVSLDLFLYTYELLISG